MLQFRLRTMFQMRVTCDETKENQEEEKEKS